MVGYVTKTCTSSGSWYSLDGTGEWSNYTNCARDDVSIAIVLLLSNLLSDMHVCLIFLWYCGYAIVWEEEFETRFYNFSSNAVKSRVKDIWNGKIHTHVVMVSPIMPHILCYLQNGKWDFFGDNHDNDSFFSFPHLNLTFFADDNRFSSDDFDTRSSLTSSRYPSLSLPLSSLTVIGEFV